ncbi:MAG: hypothetical protein OXG87_14675 [Gemmatimonadetes bacterium]|nr:hypothetical protein [Gemmatimonadota bacterium]
MPQSSQSDSTRVTVVPDTLVKGASEWEVWGPPNERALAWQDSMIEAQTLQPGHDIEVSLAERIFRPVTTTYKVLKIAAKQVGKWWNEEDEKKKIESADDDT